MTGTYRAQNRYLQTPKQQLLKLIFVYLFVCISVCISFKKYSNFTLLIKAYQTDGDIAFKRATVEVFATNAQETHI